MKQAIADVALEFLFAQDLSHGPGGLPSPHLQLEQSIPCDVIALREKQVRFALGVDMRDTPPVLDDLNRLAETRDIVTSQQAKRLRPQPPVVPRSAAEAR